MCLLRIFGSVFAAPLDGGISVEDMAPLIAGRFVLMGLAFEIVVEGLLRRLARFPRCVVRGRLKPAELLGVLLSPERPLPGRLLRSRQLLDLGGFFADSLVVTPDGAADVGERPCHTALANRDVVEVRAITAR